MKTTPYNYLLARIRGFCTQVRDHNRARTDMFVIAKNELQTGYSMSEIYERTIAAGSLGYEVIVRADEKGLAFVYRKRAPDIPAGW